MNTELLLKVRDAILAEPLKFDMASYASKSLKSPCGTTACIAGHTFAIGRHHKNLKGVLRLTTQDGCFGSRVADTAMDLLQITEEQENSLFYECWWPEKFHRQYNEAKTPLQRAKAAARRINHFIKTGK